MNAHRGHAWNVLFLRRLEMVRVWCWTCATTIEVADYDGDP